MRIVTQHKDVSLKGTLAVKEATIKSNGGHVMRMLANMYSNPLDAIVREYMTNMHDAYRALLRADPNAVIHPASIKLPNRLSPELVFQDFGIGMDFETAWNTFTSFGHSTKNDNDDEAGAFGIGCKVGFSYNNGTPWMIESVFAGLKHTIMAFVNDKNVPSFAHIATVETTERAGVTIKIPILAHDFEDVTNSVRRYAQYFPLPLVVSGLNIDPIVYRMKAVDGSWGMRTNDGNDLRIIMGNVPYEFDGTQDIPMSNFMENNGIDLYVPIGSVDVVPSRDALMYTPKTLLALEIAANKMINEFKQMFNDRLSAAKTERDALTLFDTITDIKYIHEVMTDALMWNGLSLTPATGIERSTQELTLLDPTLSVERIGQWSSYRAGINILTGEDTRFYLRPSGRNWIVRDDMPEKKGMRFMHRFLQKNLWNIVNGKKQNGGHHIGHAIYVRTRLTNAELSTFFGGYPEADILSVSDLAKEFAMTRVSTNAKSYKGTIYHYRKGWEAGHAVPSGTQYYLPLTQNGRRFRYAHNMETLQEIAGDMGFNISDVYGVKASEEPKFKAMGWLNYHEELEKLVLDEATKHVDHFITMQNMPSGTRNHHLFSSIIEIGLESLQHPAVMEYIRDIDCEPITTMTRAAYKYLFEKSLATVQVVDTVRALMGNVVVRDMDDLEEQIYLAYPIMRFIVAARTHYTPYAIQEHSNLLLDFCKTAV